ncbi:hypothetical protein DBR11_14875 [Pedobacter sp. HMWF019]|uniref:phytanoyl-CoA dioxygenase family protein n=1 Tax=Pedobacter sp. HMWF019 TaxID=2056856 RepID=UPI000D385CC6|nr:phytanoyl-CoA dioxygenase family protein [Pedobacter sp. HMWF019]PTS98468.1 hypothetical protein DBR11_14875 [Pedobacter sp. HMWF019]
MTECTFLRVFFEVHQSKKQRDLTPEYPNFDRLENIWLSIYGLGKYETYHFIYADCRHFNHFNQWLNQLKGNDFLENAAIQFNNWLIEQPDSDRAPVQKQLLNEEQLQFWEQYGYLKISDLIEPELCDEVKELICTHLDINLSNPYSWYTPHPDWQGLMVQIYQGISQQAIRKHPNVHQLFSELYAGQPIIANTDKLSFNPPETPYWPFKSGDLHWDIDLDKPIEYTIQGLIYLDDVPADRGPLTLVPGVHHQFNEWIKSFKTLEDAHHVMRSQVQGIPVPGKKGDIIVWLNTLPHAASANHSPLPRFVQYLSFSKL